MVTDCRAILPNGQRKSCKVVSRIQGASIKWRILLPSNEMITVDEWRVFVSRPIYPPDYDFSQHT